MGAVAMADKQWLSSSSWGWQRRSVTAEAAMPDKQLSSSGSWRRQRISFPGTTPPRLPPTSWDEDKCVKNKASED